MKKLFLLFPVTLLLLLCSACSGYFDDLPEITAEDLISAQTSFVYDENGEQIAELHGAENRISVPLSEMPQHLLDDEGTVLQAYCRFCRELMQGMKHLVPAVRFSFATFALMIIYAIALPVAGFCLSTVLYLFLQISLLAPAKKRNMKLYAIIAVIFTIFVYFTFRVGLSMLLPRGVIEALLGF